MGIGCKVHRFLVWIVVLVMALGYCAFNTAAADPELSEVSVILEKLEAGYNSMDYYTILQCFDPSMITAMTASTKMFGMDGDLVKSLLPAVCSFFSLYADEMSENKSTCKLTPISYKGNDYSGVLKYNVHLSYANGQEESFDEQLDVQKTDGVWYISMVQKSSLKGMNIFHENEAFTAIVPASDITSYDLSVGASRFGTDKSYYSPKDSYANYWVINDEGKVLFSSAFQDMKTPQDGYVPARRDSLWGFVSLDGMEVTGYVFQSVDYLENGFWKVKQNGRFGVLNLRDGYSTKCEFSDVGTPRDGIIPVRKDDYWGVVDYDGKTIVDFIYTEIYKTTYKGLIHVRLNKSYGVLDTKRDEFVLPLSPDHWRIAILPNGAFIATTGSLEYFDVYDAYGNKKAESIRAGGSYDGVYTCVINDDLVLTGDCNQNNYLINRNGEVVVDYAEKAKEWAPGIVNVRIRSEWFDGKKMPVRYVVETHESGAVFPEEHGYSNFMDIYGNLLYEKSFSGNIIDAVVSDDLSTFMVFEGEKARIIYKDTSYILPVGKWSGGYCLDWNKMHAGGEGYSWLFDPDMEMRYDFYSFHSDNGRDSSLDQIYVVVSDGAFEGILTDKGLLEKGIRYTKATLGSQGVGAYMEYGSSGTYYNIGKHGEAFRFEDNKNNAASFTPLSGGTRVEGIPMKRNWEDPEEEEEESEDSGYDDEICLYQGPGTEFDVIAVFPLGTEFNVITDDGTMAYVIVGDKNGFIESIYLSGN